MLGNSNSDKYDEMTGMKYLKKVYDGIYEKPGGCLKCFLLLMFYSLSAYSEKHLRKTLLP